MAFLFVDMNLLLLLLLILLLWKKKIRNNEKENFQVHEEIYETIKT